MDNKKVDQARLERLRSSRRAVLSATRPLKCYLNEEKVT
jgi:hypothetical protein